MKKYILEYNDYDEVIALLGHEIPHKHLEHVSTILVDLYEKEFLAIKEAEYNIKENVFVIGEDALCYAPVPIPDSQNPPTQLLDYYNLTNAHAAGFKGAGVKIGIIDTGQHDNHHAAAPNVIRHDFTIEQTGVSIEPQAHGGRACIIIGQTNQFTGTPTPGATALYGIAYEAEIHMLRVQESSTAIYQSTVIDSINYCIANNFHIINISLSMGSGLDTAINAALAAGIIVVCASGNSIYSDIAHPANMEGVIAISSWQSAIGLFGSYTTIDTHSQLVGVAYSQGHTSFTGGTSQAAFTLTGLLALYKQKYPSLNTAKAIHLLKRKSLQMDGYSYNLSSHTSTKGILENYQTGAGWIASLN